jgi:hypothetical protein
MRIFLSWSGGRSRAVALALREWLPLVLHYARPWMSDADIAAGQRWGAQIATGLTSSTYGIICCTNDNLSAPWLMFEAGALAHALADDAVCPLLLDVSFSDISGPLAQFQAKKSDAEGMLDLVAAINQKAEQPVPENRLRELFQALWPKLHSGLDAISATTATQSQARSQTEVLEELVASVRNLGRQVEALAAEGSAPEFDYDAYDPPYQLEALVVEQIRELARAEVMRTSLRKVARQAGIKVGAAKKFIDGSTPYARNLRLWHNWYLREVAGMRDSLPRIAYPFSAGGPAATKPEPDEEPEKDSGHDPDSPDNTEEDG